MSEEVQKVATATVVPLTTTTGATTTRGQHRKNVAAESEAVDDGETNTSNHNENKKKEKDVFKGKVEKMGGNVFQLADENRKGNQFTHTLEALCDYATIELDHAQDLASLFLTNATTPSITAPTDEPPLLADKVTRAGLHHRQYLEWKFECTTYNTRMAVLRTNLNKIFTVALLQCSPSVKAKLEATTDYEKSKAAHDCAWLLKTLRNICHNFEHTENRFVALVNAKAAIFAYRQTANQTITEFYEGFKELVAVLESYDGKIHDPVEAAPASLTDALAALTLDKEKDNLMKDRYLAILFIRNTDGNKYGQLKTDLSNDFGKGRDEYPKSLVLAHQLLLKYKGGAAVTKAPQETSNNNSSSSRRNRGGQGRGRNSGRGGGQNDGPNTAQPNQPRSAAATVAAGAQTGRSYLQVALSLAQVDDHFPDGIPDYYVLLDSDSTVSIFRNPDLLKDIHVVDDPLLLETNGGGRQVSNQMGTLEGFGPVWYNPESLANVLSLAQVRRLRRVTLDTAIAPTFKVHHVDGISTTEFIEHASGLYLFDASVKNDKKVDLKSSSPSIIAYSCLQTVANNKANYTARQIKAADAARALYRLVGRPGYARFIIALKENHILNCPVTVEDARRAELIYGKDIAFLKGKTTASAAKPHVEDFIPTALPPDILTLHPTVTLCIDLFYVLGLGFHLSTSRNIHYLSCHAIADRTKSALQECLKKDLKLYQDRGFQPTAVHADGEFNTMRSSFPNIHFTICSADDHVPEIERAIRTVKEYVRTTIHGMPYARLPRILVRELATAAIRNINMFPHPDGISNTMSPATLVTGVPKSDYRTMKLEFGEYVQVYDGTSNDTKSRTLGAIATNPTGNSNGDYYFMSLATGHRIQRRSWSIVPINDTTISRVEAIALNEGMPLVDTDDLLTEYDPYAAVDDAAYDRTFVPSNQPDPESDHTLTSNAYTDTSDDDDDESTDDNGHHPDFDDDQPIIPRTTNGAGEERNVPNEAENTAPILEAAAPSGTSVGTLTTTTNDTTVGAKDGATVGTTKNQSTGTIPNVLIENEERTVLIENEERTEQTPVENEERPQTVAPTRPPGLRPPQPANYSYRYGFTQTATSAPIALKWHTTWKAIEKMSSPPPTGVAAASIQNSIRKAITGLMFTQMSAHKGIKKHGQSALDALKKEFLQFKALNVLEPLDAFTLTEEQKSESLRALSVIKEKRDGSLKGRTCADGSKQHGKYTHAETGSPTISNDALFISIMIDAFERRDVATADIAGAYLHALMKDFITMRFVGWAVDLLCEVNPEYKAYVVYEGKVKVIYTRCNKAIYGCVVSGVLWYELFTDTLEKLGFVTNPYDFCIANATIEGSQCTIGWFVDDTKISHINPNVVTNIVDTLEKRFGKMTVTRGKEHKFLGMNIKYLNDGTATIHMPSYIQEAVVDSGLEISGSPPSPCANSLFSLDRAAPPLSEARAKTFHSIVAKLIYVGTRARTDILLALSFLCGRVTAPTTQDEKKLQRLLSYLNSTIDLPLRIGADSLSQFTTWVDASFAIHPDMRSHTGGVLSFGRGGLICKSKRQNINTKSSTEAELVGASDYLPHTMYVKMFMEAQGYPIKSAIFNQDNESAIKMESNGKSSCGQRSRHIDIRYFFITDQSKRKNIDITHCPTADMLADFFTKPLQGSLFRKFRSVLLGEDHCSILDHGRSPSPPEERVESKNDPNVVLPVDMMTSCSHLVPGYLITTSKNPKNNSIIDSTVNVNVNNTPPHSIEKYPEV